MVVNPPSPCNIMPFASEAQKLTIFPLKNLVIRELPTHYEKKQNVVKTFSSTTLVYMYQSEPIA